MVELETIVQPVVIPTLQNLAEQKIVNWNKLSEGKAKAVIAGYTPTRVYIEYNSYGKRIKKPFVAKANKKGEFYLNSHKGKVVGKAI